MVGFVDKMKNLFSENTKLIGVEDAFNYDLLFSSGHTVYGLRLKNAEAERVQKNGIETILYSFYLNPIVDSDKIITDIDVAGYYKKKLLGGREYKNDVMLLMFDEYFENGYVYSLAKNRYELPNNDIIDLVDGSRDKIVSMKVLRDDFVESDENKRYEWNKLLIRLRNGDGIFYDIGKKKIDIVSLDMFNKYKEKPKSIEDFAYLPKMAIAWLETKYGCNTDKVIFASDGKRFGYLIRNPEFPRRTTDYIEFEDFRKDFDRISMLETMMFVGDSIITPSYIPALFVGGKKGSRYKVALYTLSFDLDESKNLAKFSGIKKIGETERDYLPVAIIGTNNPRKYGYNIYNVLAADENEVVIELLYSVPAVGDDLPPYGFVDSGEYELFREQLSISMKDGRKDVSIISAKTIRPFNMKII